MTQAQYQLKITENSKEKIIDLKENFKVGRDNEMDLFIEDPSVSGEHAVISIEKNTVYVKDLGSTNGTFVNDQKVESRKELKNGDIVSFGNYKSIFIDAKVRSKKKYITMYSTANRTGQHDVRVVTAEKKLSAAEVKNCKITTGINTNKDLRITPICPGCIYTPGAAYMNIDDTQKALQWLITPMSRKASHIVLRLQKEDDRGQDITMRLNQSSYYANKCIRLAFILPVLFFFLDGVAFKGAEAPFIIGCFLQLVGMLGGFTITGILLGILFTALGLVLNNRAQVIDLYYKEVF